MGLHARRIAAACFGALRFGFLGGLQLDVVMAVGLDELPAGEVRGIDSRLGRGDGQRALVRLGVGRARPLHWDGRGGRRLLAGRGRGESRDRLFRMVDAGGQLSASMLFLFRPRSVGQLEMLLGRGWVLVVEEHRLDELLLTIILREFDAVRGLQE